MIDDLRNHDAAPSEGEIAWIVAQPVAVVVKALALAGVAIAIGVSLSQLLVDENAYPPVAVFAAK
jgi:hypothetical protein